MSKKLLAVFIAIMLAGMAFATKHDDEALRFFRLNTPADRVADMIDENYDSVLAIFLDGMEQEMGFDLSAEDRAPMRELLDFILEAGLDYEKLEELSIPIIKSQFSLKELEELNRFLSSKTGSKYLDLYILNNTSYLATAIEQLFDSLSEDEEMVEKIGNKMMEIYGIDPDEMLRDMIDGALDDEYEEGDDYGFEGEYGYEEDEEIVPADTTATEDSDEESLNLDEEYKAFLEALESLGQIIEDGVKAVGDSEDTEDVYSDPIVDINAYTIKKPDDLPKRDIEFVPYDIPPKVIGQISPEYPEASREAGIQGTVVLEAEIYMDGSIGEIRVKRSVQAGPGGLDEAAIKAVRAVTFEPGKADGKAVDSLVIIPVEFRLK